MPNVIVFQGDSVTDCGRRAAGSEGYPTTNWGPGYPGLIGAKLTGEQPERGWQIINRGVSGNCITDLCSRWKNDCLNLKPDIVSILIGVNDTGREFTNGGGVEAQFFDRFYRTLLDWTLEKNPHVKFVLIEPSILPFGLADASWQEEIDRKGAVIRKIAEDYRSNAVFVSLQKKFQELSKKTGMSYWFADGLHPNPAGHQIIAQEWLKAAERFLKC